MTVDRSNKYLIFFCRQFRFGYFYTLFAISFNPDFCERMLMAFTFPEHVYVPAVVIYIK